MKSQFAPYILSSAGFYGAFDKIFKGAKFEEGFAGSGKAEVISHMKEFGDGARGEVYVAWEEGGAHVFVAENRNGEIHFLDPQSGELDVEYFFEHVKDGLTKLLLMDNLEPDEKYISGVVRRSSVIISLREAIKIAERKIPNGHSLCESYGKAQGKYVFSMKNSRGTIPPGGLN